jgi:hypothetical protein
MQAIHHFIIEVKDPFKDKIEIGKIELFVDKKISRDRSANRFGKIISCPIIADSCELKEGFEIIFDATVLYRQVYKEGVQESIHLMDKANSLYKIEPDMIVLFRENKESEWKGYKDNLMVEFLTEVPKLRRGGLIDMPEGKTVKGKAMVKYRNEELENQEIENGQVVFIRPDAGIPFFFKNETLYWIRTKDVLAV